MEDLHLFLSHANKSFEDQSESPITVVMGNEASDMDSVVTSIIHAYLCHHISGGIFVPILSIPSEDLKLRTDQFYLYERLGFNYGLILGFSDYLVKRLEQLQAENRLKFIITDHNEVKGYFKKFADNVIAIIDHHVDSGIYTNKSNVSVQIEMVGSATSLVAEKVIEHAKHFITKEVATLLLAPILIDTINLEPSRNRVTPKDASVASFLLPISQVNQSEFFNQLQAAKFNDDALGTVDKLRKDYKGGQVGSFKYGISAVLASVEQWLAKEQHLTQQFDSFMKQNGIELLFATLAYYDQANKFYRELIVYGRNGQQIVDKLPAEFKLRAMDSEKIKKVLNHKTGEPLLFYHIENIDVARKVLQPAVDQVLKAFSANI